LSVRVRIDPDHPNSIIVDPDRQHKPEMQSLLSGTYRGKYDDYLVPLSWTACLNLRGLFGTHLVIDDTLLDWSLKHYRRYIQPSLALRDAIDADHLRFDDPTAQNLLETAQHIGAELGLYPHQTAGAAFMALNRSAGIFDETGTGKSAQTIGALHALHHAGESIFPALIVCPTSVRTSWAREFQQWWPEVSVRSLEGTPVQRKKILDALPDILVVNWELLPKYTTLAAYGALTRKRCPDCKGPKEGENVVPASKCEVHPREFNTIGFRTVVGDEAHRIMTATNKSTRAFWCLGDTAEFRFGLTGTPIQSDIVDLWPLLRFLRPTAFPSKDRFLKRYANIGLNSFGAVTFLGLQEANKEEFYAVTAPFTRRMLKKIVVPFLPPVLTETRTIPMTPAQLKAYRAIKKSSVAQLEGGGTLVASTVLSKFARMMQLSSACLELVPSDEENDDSVVTDDDLGQFFRLTESEEDFGGVRLTTPSNKIQAFLEELGHGDFGTGSMVIAAQSKQLLELLAHEMKRKGYEFAMFTGAVDPKSRQRAVDAFQNGSIRFLLLTIAAGNAGLTLTAASTMVVLQKSWSSVQMTQLYNRVHRIGSEIHDNITIIFYVSEGSIEIHQDEVLDDKGISIKTILRDGDLLRKYLTD